MRLLRLQLHLFVFSWLVLLGASCPRRLDPQNTPTLAVSDDRTRAQFEAATKLFRDRKLEQADRAFRDLAAANRQDQALQQALALYRGRIALELGKPQRAYSLLALTPPPVAGLREQIAFYRGLAAARTERYRETEQLLAPQLDRLDRDARPAALVALSRADEQLGAPRRAIARLVQIYELTERPAERAFAVDGIRRLLAQAIEPAQLPRLQAEAEDGGVLLALVLERRLLLARRQGTSATLRALTKKASESRRAHQLAPLSALGIRPGRPVLGVLLPRSGRYRAVSRLALEGIAHAAGALGRPTGMGPLEVLVRDSSKNPAETARQLIEDEGAVALLGLFAPRAVRQVQEIAIRSGVPLLCLAPEAASQAASPLVLQLLPSNSARAKQLATVGLRRSANRRAPVAAQLIPDSAFGKTMSDSFGAAWRGGGGRLGPVIRYAANERVFTAPVARLTRAEFDVLFVPERASRIGLIAASLAKVGVWTSARRDESSHARTVLMLATADGLSRRVVQSAHRYLQGALLAPGYYHLDRANSAAPSTTSPVHDLPWSPGLVAAVAYDGALVVRQFLANNPPDSEALVRALQSPGTGGMTGALHFDQQGLRADQPLVYTIQGDRVVHVPHQ
jgi:ABC-type branched-subunit amino acid transport system substrate-binding protein